MGVRVFVTLSLLGRLPSTSSQHVLREDLWSLLLYIVPGMGERFQRRRIKGIIPDLIPLILFLFLRVVEDRMITPLQCDIISISSSIHCSSHSITTTILSVSDLIVTEGQVEEVEVTHE